MADANDGGVTATDDSAGANEGGVLDHAVQKVREQKEEKVDFKVTKQEDLPKARRAVTIEVARAEYDKRSKELFKDLQNNATIEGFRKGKAPRHLLERRYGQAASRDIVEKMASLVVRDYEKENNLTIYGVPVIKDYKVEAGQSVVIELDMEIKPDLKPTNYTGLTIESPKSVFKDSMMDDELHHLSHQAASLEEVEESYNPEKHRVVIDVHAVNQKGHTVTKESDSETAIHQLPEKLREKLKDMKAGESFEANVDDVKFTVQVKAVKSFRNPEINDDFAKDMEYENLDALKTAIRERIDKQLNEDNIDQAFDVLTAKLIESEQFDVPEALKLHVEREMMQNDMQYVRQTGMLPPRMTQDTTRAEYVAEVEEEALNRVKGFLLIDAIGQKENITADDESIEKALAKLAEEQKRRPIAVRASMERAGQWDRFVEQVRFEKIRQFLLDNTTINYVDKKEEEPDEDKTPTEAAETEKAGDEGDKTPGKKTKPAKKEAEPEA